MKPAFAALLAVAGLAIIVFLPAYIEWQRMKRDVERRLKQPPPKPAPLRRRPPLRIVSNERTRYRMKAIDEDLPGAFNQRDDDDTD